jgi:hypothetical protein
MGKLYLFRVNKPSGIENIAIVSRLPNESLENETGDCISREYPEFNIANEFIISKLIIDTVNDSFFEYDNMRPCFIENRDAKVFKVEDYFIISIDDVELMLGFFSPPSIIDRMDFNRVYVVY